LGQGKLNFSQQTIVRPIKANIVVRVMLGMIYMASIVAVIGLTIMVCEQCPTANQHAFASAVLASLLLASAGSNMVRAFAFSWCQLPYLTPACVRSLLADINALQNLESVKQSTPIQLTAEKINNVANTEVVNSGDVSEIQMVVDDCIKQNKHLARRSIV